MSEIREVTLHPLRIPFQRSYQIAAGDAHEYLEVIIVEIETHQGVVGLGETQVWRRHGSGETLTGLLEAISELLVPQLIGQSVFDIALISQRLDQVLSGRLSAKAALLDALIDAQARTLNIPAYQILGGRARDTVETGAVLTLRSQLADTIEEALKRYQQGYRHFSVKVGRSINSDVERVAELRKVLGNEVRILIDANASLSFAEAAQLLQRIEPYNIEAAEQPLAAYDLPGLQDLSSRTSIPLILDESVSHPYELLTAIKSRAAQGVHTKMGKNGGVWRTRELWQIAHAAGWRVRPGNFPATSVATYALAHLAVAWPHEIIVSPFTSSALYDLEDDIVCEKLQITAGKLHLLDAPGWGVTLDREKLARWRVSPTTGVYL